MPRTLHQFGGFDNVATCLTKKVLEMDSLPHEEKVLEINWPSGEGGKGREVNNEREASGG